MTKSYSIAPVILAVLFLLSPMAVLSQVSSADLETRDGRLFKKGANTPYSGQVVDEGQSEGSVRDGLRVGDWIWYRDGQRVRLESFEEGIRRQRTSWHQNGVRSSLVDYDREGKITGWMKHWDTSGVLRESHSWEAGVEHGEAKLFDHRGKLLRTGNFSKGVRDGAEIWWYPDGKRRWETMYKSGQRTGTWVQYGPDGKVMMTSVWDNGEFVSRIDPHKDH